MSLSVDRIGFAIASVPPIEAIRGRFVLTISEFKQVHGIYQAIIEGELKHGFPLPQVVEDSLREGAPDGPLEASAGEWLEVLDLAVTPHLIRSYFKERSVEEATLRAMVRSLK